MTKQEEIKRAQNKLLSEAISLNVLRASELEEMMQQSEDELAEYMDFSHSYNNKTELIILSVMNTAWCNRMNEGAPFQSCGAYSKMCALNDNIARIKLDQ